VVKLSLFTPWRRIGGRGIDPLIVNLGAWWYWAVSITNRRFQPPGKSHGAHWTGGCVGSRDAQDDLERRKCLCSCRDPNPVTWPLYRLRSFGPKSNLLSFDKYCLLVCDAVYFGRYVQRFQENMPPSTGGWWWWWWWWRWQQVYLKLRYVQVATRLHAMKSHINQ
jgi:hypothetical protein